MTLWGAMALAVSTAAAPTAARDLIIIDGPITAEDVKCDNCVQRKDIGGRAVSTAKIRNNAVSTAKIRGGAVTTGKMADGAVTTDKIADGSITEEKLAFGVGGNDIAPFRVVAQGGVCDTETQGASTPRIEIDNTGLDEFVITSILIRTSGVPPQGFSLNIYSLEINNFVFDTRTNSIVGPASGTSGPSIFESADLMGTPVQTGFQGSIPAGPGGNFPHQIVASAFSDGPDIRVTFLCQSDFSDVSITGIAVSGWKYTDDTVTVTYRPGLL